MVIELSNFGGNFADLPPFESVSLVKHSPMLLLKLPQLGVDVECPAEVSLPLLVSVLRHVPEAVEQLLRLFEQMAEFVDDFALVVRSGH